MSAVKLEKESQRIVNWYQYYPGTTYGNHRKSIKFRFDLNKNDHIISALKYEKGSKNILKWYLYNPNTVYGEHASRITGIKLNVPIIRQLPELATGCEITSVTMMVNYAGANESKIKLAMEMPKHPWDPNRGFVGNSFTKNGWTIYPPALMEQVENYTGSAVNLTGVNNRSLERILVNKPVVVWVSPMHGFTVHAIVLTGYDEHYFYYNDPWTGQKNAKIQKNNLIRYGKIKTKELSAIN